MNWFQRVIFAAGELYPWQQPLNEYAKYPDFGPNGYDPDNEEQHKLFYENLKKRDHWQKQVARAVSKGLISFEQAKAYGMFSNASQPYRAMPQKMFHVTTALSKVLTEGLKTRDELNMINGVGLGGGASDTISFTDDIEIARGIKNSLLEARQACALQLTPHQMLEKAKKGEGAKRPFYEDILSQYGGVRKDQSMPIGLASFLKGRKFESTVMPESLEEFMATKKKRGETGEWFPDENFIWPHGNNLYTGFWRKMTRAEIVDANMQFFKGYSAFREAAGGPLDPCYFSTDPNALCKIPANEIGIVEVMPIDKATGYQVSALGEWRTHTGEAVKILGEVQ